MLYSLVRLVFRRSDLALFAGAVFLLSPYNLFWSRTSMIEYAAAFFGLAYLFWVIRWALNPGLR